MFFKAATGVDEHVPVDAIEAYVEWHEQSRSVWLAYERWSKAPLEDLALRFAAYLAALDQEHRACDVYAAATFRAAGSRPHGNA